MNNNKKGPIFESGPGWGEALRQWSNQHPFKLGVLLVVSFIALGFFINIKNISDPEIIKITDENNRTIEDNIDSNILPNNIGISDPSNIIEVTVAKGDSYTTVSRKAITQYLESEGKIPKIGSRLFTETILQSKIQNQSIQIGNTIAIETATIENLIYIEYEKQTNFQKSIWERNEKKIIF